jgi:hypothetical protein
MSENFISKNTPSMDKLVAEAISKATNIGDAYEQMKAELRGAMGITPPMSEADMLYGGRAPQPVPAPISPTSYVGQHQYEQIIYPHGNDRYVVTANSEEELAAKIARIQELFQQ